jgi:hypothetical protein
VALCLTYETAALLGADIPLGRMSPNDCPPRRFSPLPATRPHVRSPVYSAIRADTGDLPFLGVLMSIVSLCYLVSRFLPCGRLYCYSFFYKCIGLVFYSLDNIGYALGPCLY